MHVDLLVYSLHAEDTENLQLHHKSSADTYMHASMVLLDKSRRLDFCECPQLF